MADVRVVPAQDAERFLQTDLLVWFDEPPQESAEHVLSGMPEDLRFGAEVEGSDSRWYAGVYGVYPLTLTVPGPHQSLRQLPVAGLTFVGVHPDQRRRGVLTAMLGDHFERTREGDWSGLSVLHASEPAIYGRHGYGTASWEETITLGRGAKLTSPGLDEAAGAIRTSMTSTTDADVAERIRAIALEAGVHQLGAIVREAALYARFSHDTPQTVRDREPQRVLFAQQDGKDVGYAWIRRTPGWEDGEPKGTLSVMEMTGSPAAELALARRLVDMDLISKITFSCRSTDDPLIDWVGSPRSVQGPAHDSLWVRLVDLPKALTARGYATACDVVLQVEDTRCAWNDGRWRLRVDNDGQATVERTDADADLTLTTQMLASAYLGARSLVTQHRSGLLTEARAGAVAELDASMQMSMPAVGAVGF
ncbi:GNAT family N-acetyltransferase [Luteipulveratus mongoliensis]|uniref:GNAT family N-acetyltransferase n=1 Tax=Luteipulveratus mongoliensis TaxID=571913 RepID=UPI000696FD52|nr:GNAT family N-acetyltransferase [Luteipulveratus mongoliensis]